MEGSAGVINVEKTNVMRLLEQKKIPYTARTYEADATKSGVMRLHSDLSKI